MDFENALRELESIVKKLESNSASLEDGIELFEKGITISKECFSNLAESKKKIESIKAEMDKLLSPDSDD